MKKILIILLITLGAAGVGMAQGQDRVFQQLAQAFQQGDHQTVSNAFASTLDVSINHKDGSYGKQQATALLRDFFSQNRPSGFSIKHTGASQGQSYYAVCEMQSQMNKWQVYLLLNTNYKIIQLKINN